MYSRKFDNKRNKPTKKQLKYLAKQQEESRKQKQQQELITQREQQLFAARRLVEAQRIRPYALVTSERRQGRTHRFNDFMASVHQERFNIDPIIRSRVTGEYFYTADQGTAYNVVMSQDVFMGETPRIIHVGRLLDVSRGTDANVQVVGDDGVGEEPATLSRSFFENVLMPTVFPERNTGLQPARPAPPAEQRSRAATDDSPTIGAEQSNALANMFRAASQIRSTSFNAIDVDEVMRGVRQVFEALNSESFSRPQGLPAAFMEYSVGEAAVSRRRVFPPPSIDGWIPFFGMPDKTEDDFPPKEKFLIETSTTDDNCVICCESYLGGEVIRCRTCTNKNHYECMSRGRQIDCPVCREPLMKPLP